MTRDDKPSEALARTIIAVLKRRQSTKALICRAVNMDYVHVAKTITDLIRSGRIIIIGSSHGAPIYGLPGTTLLSQTDVCTSEPEHGEKAGRIEIGREEMKWWPGGRRDSE